MMLQVPPSRWFIDNGANYLTIHPKPEISGSWNHLAIISSTVCYLLDEKQHVEITPIAIVGVCVCVCVRACVVRACVRSTCVCVTHSWISGNWIEINLLIFSPSCRPQKSHPTTYSVTL